METALTKEKVEKLLESLLDKCRKNLPRCNEELIKKAFYMALDAHKNDRRQSGEPYFYHPYAVAVILATHIPLDDISIAAALLHDVVEDTSISLETIKKEFGNELAEIIDGVTKISGYFKGQEIEKFENYRKLLLSLVKDLRVIIVKFADRLHNMRTIAGVHPDKQKRIARETLEIYAPLAHRFGLWQVKWELEDLSFKVINPEAYKELTKKITSKRKEREEFIEKFIQPIKEKLKDFPYPFEIYGRPKHLYSIYRKMITRNKPFEEIYDLFAIRIILHTQDKTQCYYVMGIINQLYPFVPDRFKDYISIPKSNNYQSIHTTVIGPEGKFVEVQIRTQEMHEIAELGIAAHWKYKEGKSATDDFDRYVNWIREVFENAGKDETDTMANFKLNLFQDEIYCVTPKGDVVKLPIGATPIDFAFEIHTKVGYKCIGAKVNGKIVPLDTKLHNGDMVEIITSKNQVPNKNWINFVVTHKAKMAIKKWMNKEDERLVSEGREIWEKKLKKLKITFSQDEFERFFRNLKFENSRNLFKAIALGKINIDDYLARREYTTQENKLSDEEILKTFVDTARKEVGDVKFEGNLRDIKYSFAKCCNPIPGEQIIGYVTVLDGLKIHRKDCKELLNLVKEHPERLVNVNWPKSDNSYFLVALDVFGQDKPGILKEISTTIANVENTNIKSVNIKSEGVTFKGNFVFYVKSLSHLENIIQKLKSLPYVTVVNRVDNVGAG
ncbi:MAG TPA: bifunctional (p)ppGpp synthetase/guanosine-3',5'-bis(diphosphate) 3'-pyrophosphohydrolase [Ignavibacteriales bacterium]|nr:bifunctional (p)ppGpp synthetase/guanosine-3',5'-bis(diphosphate) 3'-pyrophosphohydrolase [Ignavibacteriales bacterium]